MIYQAVNQSVFERVPITAQSVLDVGCGSGAMGQAIKIATGCTVVGITFSEEEAARARGRLDRVEVADLNNYEPAPLGQFDCIVCSHVLEHLLAPHQLLIRLRRCLAPGGMLLVALPNVLFWKQRVSFMRGRFRYTDGGLMDSTHYRFFDWASAEQLVIDAGYVVRERIADGGFPLSRWLGRAVAAHLDRSALHVFPGLFGFQFVMRCVSPE
jgi:2-polyprenyl-3-methyl-5-hydroxy-6-metoxy-1,4-benzoquinol methylase